MKALVIGLGSMGRRRARLLKEINDNIQIIGVDIQADRRKQAEEELGLISMSSISDACGEYNPDMAFVSTSPLSHDAIIEECLENYLHTFSELNLVDTGYEKNIALANEKQKTLFLSSTFLYRKEIEYISNAVKNNEKSLSYMYHSGQYLPDWHPWENYKDYFVGDKKTNGCRECMAIEFPWLIDVFGDVVAYKSVSSYSSNLDIQFPDTFQIMFEHALGHKGLIIIDVVSRKPVRNFELIGEDIYLTWGGTPDTLCVYDYNKREDQVISLYDKVENREGYSSFIIENAYKSEIVNFLNVIDGREKPRYSFEKDKKVIRLINKIEEE